MANIEQAKKFVISAAIDGFNFSFEVSAEDEREAVAKLKELLNKFLLEI